MCERNALGLQRSRWMDGGEIRSVRLAALCVPVDATALRVKVDLPCTAALLVARTCDASGNGPRKAKLIVG